MVQLEKFNKQLVCQHTEHRRKMGDCARLILVLLAAILSSSSILLDAHQHGLDCMKNPYAHGCRGVWAKRAAHWDGPLVATGDLHRAPALGSAWPQAGGVIAELRQQTHPARMQQLAGALELLFEAAGRLISLGPIDEQPAIGRRLCGQLATFEGPDSAPNSRRAEETK